jgi:GH25 family lysozyme M1 (1,4-beta-N-acetylmuramidase)
VTLQPAFIVDVSANQDHPIDWAQVKAAGCVGAILKATQGTNYKNPFFEIDLAGCDKNDIPVMAYHFAAFTDPINEAQFFHKFAGARARALDIETSTDLAWTNQFLAELRDLGKLVEDQTLVYGSASSLSDIGRGVQSRLWSAKWVTPGQPENPGIAHAACWQYEGGGTVPGIANAVDLDKWVGSQANYDSFFGLS